MNLLIASMLAMFLPVQTPSATLKVNGLSCPLCANSIDKQFARLPGVQKVDIDLGEGKVFVTFKAGSAKRPTVVDMKKAIDSGGFTMTGYELR